MILYFYSKGRLLELYDFNLPLSPNLCKPGFVPGLIRTIHLESLQLKSIQPQLRIHAHGCSDRPSHFTTPFEEVSVTWQFVTIKYFIYSY